MFTPRRVPPSLLIVLALAPQLTGAADVPILTPAELAAKLKSVEPGDIKPSPIPGVYEIAVGANVAYVTMDGRYIFRGDIFDARTSENVSESTRSRARARLLANVARDDMIVFRPADGNVKHTITVFTDVDCGYCRQFHREIDQVTALGIEVHYLAYPRTGPNTESWDKAEKVWCSANRGTALTRAKLGGDLPRERCDDAPVAAHYALGRAVGVRGTPAVFAADGAVVGGYLPPATLIQVLNGDLVVDGVSSKVE